MGKGNVVVKQAYLDLLEKGLNMKHLEQFATQNGLVVTHTDSGQSFVEVGNKATEWEPSPIEQEMDMFRMEEEMDNEFRHNMITDELLNLYLKKNADYGNSFDISLDDDGLLVAKIRLGDKHKRFESLLKKKQQEVADESMRDTLIDMANYAIMTVMWMDKQGAAKKPIPKHYSDQLDALRYAAAAMDELPTLNFSGADLDGDYSKMLDVDKENIGQYVGYNIDDIKQQLDKAKEPGIVYVDIDDLLAKYNHDAISLDELRFEIEARKEGRK